MELRSLRDAAQELERLDTVILAVSFRPPDFNKTLCEKESLSFQLLSDEDCAVIQRYGVFNEQDRCAQRVTFLIDKDGIIRAIDRKVTPATHGKDLARLVSDLQRGKQLYEAACARCHGSDGGDTSYPGTRPLKGIGNHYDEDKVIELTRNSGFVNIDLWSEDERRAMAKYVRGL